MYCTIKDLRNTQLTLVVPSEVRDKLEDKDVHGNAWSKTAARNKVQGYGIC